MSFTMIISSTSSIDFSSSSSLVEKNDLLIQEIEEEIEFLVSPWVKDCAPLPENKKISSRPVLSEKSRKSSTFSSTFSTVSETVEENISSWLEVSSKVSVSTVHVRRNFFYQRGFFNRKVLFHFPFREDVFSLVIDENAINDLYWDSFYDEQDAENYLYDSFPFIASLGNVIDSDNFRHYLSHEYISEETWKYYFPTLPYSERNNIRSGFILARLAGIVPATFVSLGFSKKAATKVYNQFAWNFYEIPCGNALEEWEKWNNRLPCELSRISLLSEDVQKKIVALWRRDPDSFYHEEKVREMGQEYSLPRNINRIYSLLQYIPSDLSEFRFNGNSVSSFLRSLEEFALPEDSSVFPDMKNWPEEFSTPTRCPKKIHKLGQRYKNCLRQKAITWAPSNWVAECDGVVFELCDNSYSYFLVDAKLPCNEEPSEEFVDFLKRKLHNI